MISKDRYKDYPESVQNYIGNVIDCLRQDYGNIPDSWAISLDIICDNYVIYLDAMKNIREKGTVTPGRNYEKTGECVKNPAFSILDRCTQTITNLLKSFSLTPMSRAKMKSLKQIEDIEDDKEEKYLESLIG